MVRQPRLEPYHLMERREPLEEKQVLALLLQREEGSLLVAELHIFMQQAWLNGE